MPSARRRTKELASDGRAGWIARTSVRERHRALIRAQWRALSGLGSAVLAVFGTAAALVNDPLQRGVILGTGLTLSACMVTVLVVLTSGTAPLMMGEVAEQWTAQELRPLSEHGWRLVNHFGLGHGDQDHMMVGPGGVVLLETKWGGTPWSVDAGDVPFRSALEQTARNARQLSLWHGVAKHGRPVVQPVLVVWGPASQKLRDLPVRRHGSGIVVMSGDRLQEWMLRQPRDRLAGAHVKGVFRRDRPASRAPRPEGAGLAADATLLRRDGPSHRDRAGARPSHVPADLLAAQAVGVPVGLGLRRSSCACRCGGRAKTYSLAMGVALLRGGVHRPPRADCCSRGSCLHLIKNDLLVAVQQHPQADSGRGPGCAATSSVGRAAVDHRSRPGSSSGARASSAGHPLMPRAALRPMANPHVERFRSCPRRTSSAAATRRPSSA